LPKRGRPISTCVAMKLFYSMKSYAVKNTSRRRILPYEPRGINMTHVDGTSGVSKACGIGVGQASQGEGEQDRHLFLEKNFA
jgi:hypothetical protein